MRGGGLGKSRTEARRRLAASPGCWRKAPASATPSHSPTRRRASAATSAPAPGPEAIAVRGQFLARDQQLMLELLADALLRPRFAPEELESLRDRHIELIKATKDSDPAELIGTYGRAFLSASIRTGGRSCGSEARSRHHPPGRAALLRRSFRRRPADPRLGGRCRCRRAQAGSQPPASAWPRAARRCGSAAAPAARRGRRVLLVDSPGSAQTYFWIGNVGVDRRYPSAPRSIS